MYRIRLVTILLAIFTIIGCGGGGGGDDPTSTIQIIPSNHDFGIVTTNNMPAPLEIKIQNNGSATLNVSDIALADTINFILDLAGGENPCKTSSPSILAGKTCTIEVDFQPGSDDTFNTILSIRSDNPNTPLVDVSLSGISEQIRALKVKINQVDSTDSCPNPTDITAYVSVTDQGGYPVAGLLKDNFSIVEDTNPIDLNDFISLRTVSQPPLSNISVAVVMDYSGSITEVPDVMDDMEENVSEFINQLGAADEAEIVKFGTIVEVVQEFTSDKGELTSAIFDRSDYLKGTALYDALTIAVDDTALRSGARKAVIVVTDGGDSSSSETLANVISDAQTEGIPIFTVGIGKLNFGPLQQMSDQTGGLFYEADNSDNTKTVFQQLADLLFIYQYILTYETSLLRGDIADLEIAATLDLITGDDLREITPCPDL